MPKPQISVLVALVTLAAFCVRDSHTVDSTRRPLDFYLMKFVQDDSVLAATAPRGAMRP